MSVPSSLQVKGCAGDTKWPACNYLVQVTTCEFNEALSALKSQECVEPTKDTKIVSVTAPKNASGFLPGDTILLQPTNCDSGRSVYAALQYNLMDFETVQDFLLNWAKAMPGIEQASYIWNAGFHSFSAFLQFLRTSKKSNELTNLQEILFNIVYCLHYSGFPYSARHIVQRVSQCTGDRFIRERCLTFLENHFKIFPNLRYTSVLRLAEENDLNFCKDQDDFVSKEMPKDVIEYFFSNCSWNTLVQHVPELPFPGERDSYFTLLKTFYSSTKCVQIPFEVIGIKSDGTLCIRCNHNTQYAHYIVGIRQHSLETDQGPTNCHTSATHSKKNQENHYYALFWFGSYNVQNNIMCLINSSPQEFGTLLQAAVLSSVAAASFATEKKGCVGSNGKKMEERKAQGLHGESHNEVSSVTPGVNSEGKCDKHLPGSDYELRCLLIEEEDVLAPALRRHTWVVQENGSCANNERQSSDKDSDFQLDNADVMKKVDDHSASNDEDQHISQAGESNRCPNRRYNIRTVHDRWRAARRQLPLVAKKTSSSVKLISETKTLSCALKHSSELVQTMEQMDNLQHEMTFIRVVERAQDATQCDAEICDMAELRKDNVIPDPFTYDEEMFESFRLTSRHPYLDRYGHSLMKLRNEIGKSLWGSCIELTSQPSNDEFMFLINAIRCVIPKGQAIEHMGEVSEQALFSWLHATSDIDHACNYSELNVSPLFCIPPVPSSSTVLPPLPLFPSKSEKMEDKIAFFELCLAHYAHRLREWYEAVKKEQHSLHGVVEELGFKRLAASRIMKSPTIFEVPYVDLFMSHSLSMSRVLRPCLVMVNLTYSPLSVSSLEPLFRPKQIRNQKLESSGCDLVFKSSLTTKVSEQKYSESSSDFRKGSVDHQIDIAPSISRFLRSFEVWFSSDVDLNMKYENNDIRARPPAQIASIEPTAIPSSLGNILIWTCAASDDTVSWKMASQLSVYLAKCEAFETVALIGQKFVAQSLESEIQSPKIAIRNFFQQRMHATDAIVLHVEDSASHHTIQWISILFRTARKAAFVVCSKRWQRAHLCPSRFPPSKSRGTVPDSETALARAKHWISTYVSPALYLRCIRHPKQSFFPVFLDATEELASPLHKDTRHSRDYLIVEFPERVTFCNRMCGRSYSCEGYGNSGSHGESSLKEMSHICTRLCRECNGLCATERCPYPCGRSFPSCNHVCFKSCGESCGKCEVPVLLSMGCEGDHVLTGYNILEKEFTYESVPHYKQLRCGESLGVHNLCCSEKSERTCQTCGSVWQDAECQRGQFSRCPNCKEQNSEIVLLLSERNSLSKLRRALRLELKLDGNAFLEFVTTRKNFMLGCHSKLVMEYALEKEKFLILNQAMRQTVQEVETKSERNSVLKMQLTSSYLNGAYNEKCSFLEQMNVV